MNQKMSGFSDEISANISEQFETLAKLGISYFEARGINGKNVSELTREEAFALRAEMDRKNIRVSSIGSPIGKVKLEEPFAPHFDLFCHVIEIAKILGAEYIRVFSFYHEGESWTREERDEILYRLRKMIRCAQENGMILLHENEKDVFGDRVERCEDLMRELYGESFRAVFDPANFVQCGEDAWLAYRKLKPYIAYVHIKDAKKDTGVVVPAGEGDGCLKEIVKDLLASGYDGFFSLEPHLGTFEGLAALELDDSMLHLPKGGEGTFTLAYRAFEKILKCAQAEIDNVGTTL